MAAAVLGLLAVGVVARSAPTHPLSGGPHGGAGGTGAAGTVPTVAITLSPTAARAPHPDPVTAGWGDVVVLALAVLVVLGVLAVAVRLRWRRARPDPAPRRAPAQQPPPTGPPATEALADAVAAGLATVAHGPVTEAVIACWLGVQAAAGRAGLPARPEETAAEFVDRVVAGYGSGAAPLHRLAELYREARFSTHRLTEAHRAEARACLDLVRTALAATRDGAGARP